MPNPKRAAWRTWAESSECPVCFAQPGEPCITVHGNRTDPHASRLEKAGRCAKCGARVPADEGPGALCDRCQLLRDLNTERARKWRRRVV
jgi:hypothetical protein